MKTQGILVGADITQEWLLPWWWDRYSKHNIYPVAFIDFGLSFEMKEWCQERGTLIPIRMPDFIDESDETIKRFSTSQEPEKISLLRDKRSVWFKKPFACLKTPFQKTLWIDADCEIRGSLQPVFSYCNSKRLSLAPDFMTWIPPIPELLPHKTYNAGIIGFEGIPSLLHKWAEWTLKKSSLFPSDQDLLSWLIAEYKEPIEELPVIFNHSRYLEDSPEVLIRHWTGEKKLEIRKQIAEKQVLPSWLMQEPMTQNKEGL